ncbi:MAG: cryptochrome/photolyase family protein [Tepidamorphaceae bacterium]
MARKHLVVILGDQLSRTISSLKGCNKHDTLVLMAELPEEASYAWHHKKKLILIFSAMRHFAEELRGDGWNVSYHRIDGEHGFKSFTDAIEAALQKFPADTIRVTHPGEWRLKRQIEDDWAGLGPEIDVKEDDRFIVSRSEFCDWAKGRKLLRMEDFYREARKRTGLLMDGKKPVGGTWNLDAENRKSLDGDLFVPKPWRQKPDKITDEVIALVEERFADHPGSSGGFHFAVTRDGAEAAFKYFTENALLSFGDYQDAMSSGHKFLYHAVISPYINVGLLDPLDVCRRVGTEYEKSRVPLNAAEGFIRQIIGWREYVRGVYWCFMPDYADRNALDASRPLPGFYWTGETDLNCLKHAIGHTLEEAYAHHIQRLMVTGNFALLAGVDPVQAHEWYLAVYADAFEWVEMPNTIGMSQFADGGLLGSKPYACSGNYINKMSDYCGGCRYDVKKRTGEDACPLNYLYWDFLERNREKLEENQRLRFAYANLDKMDAETRNAIVSQARSFIDKLDG